MNPASPRWQLVLGGCACAAEGAYLYAVDPAQGGYPVCLLHQTTGFYCAGCGATRALHALLHGHLAAALHDNLFVITLLPVALLFGLRIGLAAWCADRWPSWPAKSSAAWRGVAGLATLALAFAVMRNLPGAPFDLLRPLP